MASATTLSIDTLAQRTEACLDRCLELFEIGIRLICFL